ncbi:GldG family protein [Leptospira sp. 2 VSF19]|uniref:GldG family protein n=1 Tax=Leptospira soteropolitanensis TaxID=2950025 RepID=A0AAW5VJU5_9LEPT|nr:Gldg family protein [Leptospira soteropolitanensis]MCW7494092.1 GldG family protein [Leptospira soteropolitanensis]MCW7501642.1 GldG family protein [Leptospira soteropolitanensis]MCW7523938.1 GldG family protein [Leptospira soteropolitanensis]MCW7527803.1 GldG family protein [Leptospira soteropolitanensis]MCW7531612.1 GldG family protein [Leptospira soteropolitanensis]
MFLTADRILPFVSLFSLFAYFLFDGMVVDPKRRIIFLGVIFLFLASDTIVRAFSKGLRKEDQNRYIAASFGIGAFLFSVLRDFLDLKPISGFNEEVSAIPKVREFLLLCVVLFSIVFLLQIILLEIGKSSLEAQSNLAKSKSSLLQNAVLGFLFVLPILVAVNYFAIKRNYNFDLSSQGKFSLSQISRNLIKPIAKDVTITAFYPRPLEADGPANGDKLSAFALTRVRPDIEILLDQIKAENSHITVQFINADVEVDLLKEFGQVSNGTIFVRSKKQSLLSSGTPFVEERVIAKEPKDLEDLERKLVGALLNVTTEQKKVYFTVSNGERYGMSFKALPNEQVNRFVSSLQFLNFKVAEWGFAQGWPSKLPEDAEMLVILGPTVPFSKEAKEELTKFVLEKNGKLLITMEPKGNEDFSWLLASAGLKFKSSPLIERDEKPGFVVAKRFPDHRLTDLLQKKDMGILFPYSGYLETDATAPSPHSYKSETLLESGYEAYSDENKNGKLDPNEKRESKILSIVLTPMSLTNDKTGKIILHTGTSWITDQFIPYAMNSQFSTVSITGLFQDTAVAEIPLKKEELDTISLSDNQKLVAWVIGVFLFPGFILAVGSYFVYARRKSSMIEV